MKICSVALLILYCALTFATLFVKNPKLKYSKLIAILSIAVAITHITLYFVAQSHWAILLASLALFMAYAIANGLLLKRPHVLHWLVRFIISAVILILFTI